MYKGDYDKFILFFAGKGAKEVNQLAIDINCSKLYSFANEKRSIINFIDIIKNNPEFKGKLFVDSGAYSVFTRGIEVDIDEYIEFINTYGDNVFVFAALDVIGTGSAKSEHEASEKSWKNYLYMCSKVNPKYRDKIVPVFHANESFDVLTRMLDYTFEDGSHIPYIGLGAVTEGNRRQRREWFERAFSIIKNSSNPDVMTHAFGCTDLTVLEEFPITSADSTTWTLAAAYGGILFDNKLYTVSKRGAIKDSHISNRYSDEILKRIEKVAEQRGTSIEKLSESNTERCLFNVRECKEWEDNYKYRGYNCTKNILF